MKEDKVPVKSSVITPIIIITITITITVIIIITFIFINDDENIFIVSKPGIANSAQLKKNLLSKSILLLSSEPKRIAIV